MSQILGILLYDCWPLDLTACGADQYVIVSIVSHCHVGGQKYFVMFSKMDTEDSVSAGIRKNRAPFKGVSGEPQTMYFRFHVCLSMVHKIYLKKFKLFKK